MNHNDKLTRFVSEGLVRYGQARETIDVYEQEVKARLERLLEGKTDWKHWRPRRESLGRAKALSSGVGGSNGRWIAAWQLAAEATGAYIDIGLWWNSPRLPDSVLLYASLWAAVGSRLPVRLDDAHPPVECRVVDRGSDVPRLVVVVGPGFELEAAAELLLAELDRAMAPAVALE